jgi:serine protease AprX
MKGVAPSADLVSLRVLDRNGRGTLSSVVGAFNWVLKNQKRSHVEVLNISWGAPQATSYHKSILSALVEAAWFSGVTVVVAAGNDGPAAGSITAPATDPFVVSVGSFGDHGTAAAGDDTYSSFSGRGPTLDGFAKPDLLAPGEHVASLRAKGVTYLGTDGAPIGSPSDPYVHMSGTSASAAFVSGVAALVASAHKRFTPTQVKGALVASTRPIAGSSAGAVDAPNALVRTSTANAGLRPSRLLLQILAKAHQLKVTGITWEGVSWDGVTWDGVTWDGVTWDAVSWESVTWETVAWETVAWETVAWEGVSWDDVIEE